MNVRTHLEFKSTTFPAYPFEDQEINPGRYGKRLAEFLVAHLPGLGFPIKRLVAEDWGWMVQLENAAFPLWIGCGNYEEFPDGFLCFIEPSKPRVRRWFSSVETKNTVERLSDALETALRQNGSIYDLRWWSEDEVSRG